MLEMAVLGAKMNPRSIELGLVYDMPIYVASSFSNKTGTLIHGGEHTMEVRKAVTGIAVDRNVGKITVRGVIDRPGIAAGLLQPLADAGVSVDACWRPRYLRHELAGRELPGPHVETMHAADGGDVHPAALHQWRRAVLHLLAAHKVEGNCEVILRSELLAIGHSRVVDAVLRA